MATAFTIPTIFTAVDQMSPTVQRMRQNVIGFGNSTEAALNRVERTVRKLTPGLGGVHKQLLSMVGTGAILAGGFQLGAFSFNSLADYETAVDSFRVIVSDLNDAEFTPFQNKINEVARDTKRSGTEVATAFEQIASKNATFAQTADGLGQVTKASITLAKASRMDLGVAAESLVGIMNQFSFGAEKANRTINVLAAGQAVGAASIAQTAEAFVNLGPTAASANVTLEESVGLIQTLAKFSLYGADAGTVLRGSIIKLQKAGLGYKSGQFSINDALDDTNKLLGKVHTAKQKDALITAIFGIHNITAGKILTANRDTYHQFTAAVTGTSEAQKGADINSGNLRTTIQQLSSEWVNYITTSDKVGSGMETVSNASKWLTNNIGFVVDKVVLGTKIYLGYKAAMLTARSAMFAWNVTLGISSALQGASSLAMAGNTTALGAQRVALWFTRTALMGETAATVTATEAQWGLNAAYAANPIGFIVLGIAALAAGVAYLTYREGELTKQYAKQQELNVLSHINAQTEATKGLAKQWQSVGYSAHDATIKALQYQVMQANQNVGKAQSGFMQTQDELFRATDAAWFPAFNSDVLSLREELKKREAELNNAMGDKLGSLNAIDQATSSGAISNREGANIKLGRSLSVSPMTTQIKKKEYSPENQQLIDEMNATISGKIMAEVTIKNDSDSTVSIGNGKTKTVDVQPKTVSTKVLQPVYGR